MTVSGPSNDELYELILLNAARLDPLQGAGLYLTSAAPLTSSDTRIQSDITVFGVDGMTLYNAILGLTPVQPLAWNDTLAGAARTHNGFMISGDTQSHQVTSLGEGNLTTRIGAAGYGYTYLGENVFAYAESDLETQAAFFIDWGAPGNGTVAGMQSPPGHRNNIMGVGNIAANFREVGIGITPQVPAIPGVDVGPLVVTEDFGNRANLTTPLIFGAVYDDTDGSGMYSPTGDTYFGNLTISVAGGGNSTSNAAGYFQAAGLVGNNTLTFGGADLPGNFTVAFTGLSASQNIYMEVVNGNKLGTSGNVTVSGNMTKIRGYGALGLTLVSGDATGRDIRGGNGNDIITGNTGDDQLDGRQGNDTLTGGLGNNSLSGGAGIDTAVFSGNKSTWTIAHNGNQITISKAGEVDSLNQIEKAQFADQTITLGEGSTHTDFNTDNNSDLLLQNGNDGRVKVWLMNGAGYVSGTTVGGAPGTAWHVIGSGDFNDDGKTDILWQNSDGTIAIWLMNGTAISSSAVIANPGTTWKAVAIGDFNADGSADILFQNVNGQAAVWLMNGTTKLAGSALVGGNPGTSWKIIGAADVSGDSFSDILWQSTSGQAAIWAVGTDGGGNVIQTGGSLAGLNPGTSWTFKAAGDFNADGNSDLLWQASDGTPAIWLMGGNASLVASSALPNPGTTWNIVGTGDFNGDGKADILWQNVDGTPGVWLMNGYTVQSTGAVFSLGTQWHAISMST